MIELSRLNGKSFFLNPELVETIESTPDTLVTLVSGKTVMVRETIETTIEKIFEYRGKILRLRLNDLESGSS